MRCATYINLRFTYLLIRQFPTSKHRCDKRLQRLQKILCKRVYYFVHVYLNKKLEEISYSEITVPWFEQREFISDSDSDEDN